MTLKINPKKYNWPQKTFKPLKNTFPGSKCSFIVMRIEQSEVYVKVFVTEFCVFLTGRGTVTNLWFFDWFKTIWRKQNPPRF